ncbi:MAG: polyhydroxyalkanoate synthesis repressor PhaR [Burkholderiaceae bacterium]
MAKARRSPPHESPAQESAASPIENASPGQRVLKKYPNRRLYDTQTSSYITLADVKQMVLVGQDFVVRDAKSGEDLTRSILLQIILDEESAGVPLFSAQMLSQIIRFYGHAMQGVMGSYLEKNLTVFTDMQARVAEQSKGVFEPQLGLGPDAWNRTLAGQAPGMQGLMSDYLERSRQMFLQMQEQMSKQAETLFPGMPGWVPPKR